MTVGELKAKLEGVRESMPVALRDWGSCATEFPVEVQKLALDEDGVYEFDPEDEENTDLHAEFLVIG